jgi:hypothetical protein
MKSEKLKDLFEDFFGRHGRITGPIRAAKYWVRHRTIDKYHVVKTDLEPNYYDVDTRMLHAVMALVCVYVEDEQGGYDELIRWGNELIGYSNDANEPFPGATKQQGEKDLGVADIYRWWKHEYPADCKTRDDMIHELFGGYRLGHKFTDTQQARYDEMRKLEEKIDADEQTYLHKAIDLRRGMWT